MFRTFAKLTITAVLIASSSGGAIAQSQTGSDKSQTEKVSPEVYKMMLDSVKSANSPVAADLKSRIEDQIHAMIKEVSKAPTITGKDDKLSIGDIDKLNRSAEREKNALEYEKARLDRMKVEIQRLMTLYDTINTIEDDAAQRAAQKREELNNISKLDPVNETPKKNDASNYKSIAPMLPRVIAIYSTGGKYLSNLSLPGGTEKVFHVGDMTPQGLVVGDINSMFVSVHQKGQTETYNLYPEAAPKTPAPTSNRPTRVDAVDLSKVPMTRF